MTIKKIITTSCLLSLLMIAQTVSASNLPGAFTLSPQIGGYIFEGNQDGRLDNALVYNLAFGYNYNKNLGVEAGYSYLSTETERGKSNTINTGRLDVLYHLYPEKAMVPFIIAGLGASHANMNDDDDIILEYGLGLKYFLSDNVALRGEAKHVFDCNAGDNGNNQTCYNNFSYTFGFTIQNDKW